MEVPLNLSTILKYRIHELAKDFGVPSKGIMDLLTAAYGTVPKNHMQILTEEELNYLFDYLTQETQTADINAALMAQLKRRAEKPAPKAVEPEKKAEPEKAPEGEKKEAAGEPGELPKMKAPKVVVPEKKDASQGPVREEA